MHEIVKEKSCERYIVSSFTVALFDLSSFPVLEEKVGVRVRCEPQWHLVKLENSELFNWTISSFTKTDLCTPRMNYLYSLWQISQNHSEPTGDQFLLTYFAVSQTRVLIFTAVAGETGYGQHTDSLLPDGYISYKMLSSHIDVNCKHCF